jgi:hypothetical protein
MSISPGRSVRFYLEVFIEPFQDLYQQAAQAFRWTFTRAHLRNLLARLNSHPLRPAA